MKYVLKTKHELLCTEEKVKLMEKKDMKQLTHRLVIHTLVLLG